MVLFIVSMYCNINHALQLAQTTCFSSVLKWHIKYSVLYGCDRKRMKIERQTRATRVNYAELLQSKTTPSNYHPSLLNHLVHLIVRASPHHSPHFRSHHLSQSFHRPFTPESRLKRTHLFHKSFLS